MILTCPDCATRYFVDDAKLGGEGRSVRCASCGARWTARAEPVLELVATPEAGAMAVEPKPAPPAPEPEPLKAPALAFRARVAEKKSMRRAAVHGIIWAGMAASVAAALAVGVIFRVDIVKMIPRSASAYAMAGMPVNAVGLVFEDISASPALQDGHAALVVSGVVRNIQSEPITAPPLHIAVLNKAGAPVGAHIEALADAVVPPGEARHFVIPVLDPPSSADGVEVTFALNSQARAPAAHGAQDAHAPAAPSLRGSVDSHAPASAHSPEPAHAPAPEPAHAPAAEADSHGAGH